MISRDIIRWNDLTAPMAAATHKLNHTNRLKRNRTNHPEKLAPSFTTQHRTPYSSYSQEVTFGVLPKALSNPEKIPGNALPEKYSKKQESPSIY
jgi:hypothetical protein